MTWIFLWGIKQRIMKYLIWSKASHLLWVAAYCNSILKWKLELLTCFEKKCFWVWLPKQEDLLLYPEKWLIMCAPTCTWACLCSITFEPCIFCLRKFDWSTYNISVKWGNTVLVLTFGKIMDGTESCACLFQHHLCTAAEINWKGISPISKWKENLHILQNAAVVLALTREILLKWILNKAINFLLIKFTVQNLFDNAIK